MQWENNIHFQVLVLYHESRLLPVIMRDVTHLNPDSCTMMQRSKEWLVIILGGFSALIMPRNDLLRTSRVLLVYEST